MEDFRPGKLVVGVQGEQVTVRIEDGELFMEMLLSENEVGALISTLVAAAQQASWWANAAE